MYTEEITSMGLVQVGTGATDDLSAAAVHTYSYAVKEQVCVRRLCVLVTTAAVSGGTDAIIEFNARPTFGSAASEVALGTVTIPDGTAAGQIIFKDISPTDLFPGGELSFEITTAAGTSGNALYGVIGNLDPEAAANQSQMTASA